MLSEILVAARAYWLEEITGLTPMMYNHGYFPYDLNKFILITLPKISGTSKSDTHHTVRIMSHITKLILRVVMSRVCVRTLPEIVQEQYGFMSDKGTRNAYLY